MNTKWRPENWEQMKPHSYAEWNPENDREFTSIEMELVEASADAMLNALRALRDKQNAEYNLKSPLVFIPDDEGI